VVIYAWSTLLLFTHIIIYWRMVNQHFGIMVLHTIIKHTFMKKCGLNNEVQRLALWGGAIWVNLPWRLSKPLELQRSCRSYLLKHWSLCITYEDKYLFMMNRISWRIHDKKVRCCTLFFYMSFFVEGFSRKVFKETTCAMQLTNVMYSFL
jgi:uncharacterized protein YbdZ (MbtH family)